MTVLKALKYKSWISFQECQQKIVEFTDSNLYNLLPSKNDWKSSKQLKIIFLCPPVLNALQY